MLLHMKPNKPGQKYLDHNIYVLKVRESQSCSLSVQPQYVCKGHKTSIITALNPHLLNTVLKRAKIIVVSKQCLTYPVPQWSAVCLQHKQLVPECPIYLQLLTNPKRQVISSPQRTLSRSSSGREEKGHSNWFRSSLTSLTLSTKYIYMYII